MMRNESKIEQLRNVRKTFAFNKFTFPKFYAMQVQSKTIFNKLYSQGSVTYNKGFFLSIKLLVSILYNFCEGNSFEILRYHAILKNITSDLIVFKNDDSV